MHGQSTAWRACAVEVERLIFICCSVQAVWVQGAAWSMGARLHVCGRAVLYACAAALTHVLWVYECCNIHMSMSMLAFLILCRVIRSVSQYIAFVN